MRPGAGGIGIDPDTGEEGTGEAVGWGTKVNTGPEALDSWTRTGRVTRTGPRVSTPSTSMPLVWETSSMSQPWSVGRTRRWVPETIVVFSTTMPLPGRRPTVNSRSKTSSG